MAENLKLNQYEGMFLLGPIATAEPETALTMVRGIIEKHGGQINVIKKWDERKLTYEVDGQKRGTYFITYFKAPSAAIVHIERDVTLSENVLRMIVLRADHLSQKEMESVEPQPIIPREERPSWDRGYGSDRGGDRGGDRGFDRGGDRGGDRAPRPPRRDEIPDPANKD